MGRLLREKRKEETLFCRGEKRGETYASLEKGMERDDNNFVPDLRPFRTISNDLAFHVSNVTRIERKRFRWRVMSFLDLGYVVYDL